MKIVTCNSNNSLALEISKKLKKPLCKSIIKRFADMEIFVEILENVRGEDVFVIQSTSYPANDNLMELLITIDALKRGSAKRITAVIPYFGYARQDRKTGPRTPITAKLVSNLITNAGADRVLTLDLHAGQIQGFFDIPTDNLYSSPIFIRDIKKKYKVSNITFVSPDVGGITKAREIATQLKCDIAIIDKRRPKAGKSEVMNIIGNVKNKTCIIVDDIVDSAGTLCNAAKAIKKKGAKKIAAYITHGVFSGKAISKISKSDIEKLVVTDSIEPNQGIKNSSKIDILSVSNLLSEAIKRISTEKSVSVLFD
tara:strand:+ start:1577 stop:2509 length:933 start_codon:yes stop_codon:yes gene_type:complete